MTIGIWETASAFSVIAPYGAMGLVYELEYSNGMKYIGKKNLFSIRKKKPLKNGKTREGHIRFTFRIERGKRVPLEEIRLESNWRTYNGSHGIEDYGEPIGRRVLAFAFNNAALSYLEIKAIVLSNALESSQYINNNIAGAYFSKDINNGKTYTGQLHHFCQYDSNFKSAT